MSSMNSRLKGFGFGKRKSTASIQGPDLPPSAGSTPPPTQIPHQLPSVRLGPTPSIASSASGLSMNHLGAGNRPPSYSANFPSGAPPLVGRTSPLTNQGPTRTPPSQMVGGPPPINTGAPVPGYPPQIPPIQQGGPPPPMGGPPGYGGGGGYPPPAAPGGGPTINQQFQRPSGGNAAEVEGNSRSKAQLIVGIDFVSCDPERIQRENR